MASPLACTFEGSVPVEDLQQTMRDTPVEEVIRVPLSAWQAASRDRMCEALRCRLGCADSAAVGTEYVRDAVMQLKKVACHPYIFEPGYALGEDGGATFVLGGISHIKRNKE